MNKAATDESAPSHHHCPETSTAADILPELQYWQQEKGPDTEIWSRKDPERYITFETDCAGLNNIRMAFECVVSMAVFTGRTLVLPPPEPWVFIDYDYENRREFITRTDYASVFDIEALKEFAPVVTAAGFLERRVPGLSIPGDVERFVLDESPLPAGDFEPGSPLPWSIWLREHATVVPWNPVHTLYCHPDIRRVVNSGLDPGSRFVDNRALVEFDESTRDTPVLHFPADYRSGRRSFGQALNMVAFAAPELSRMHRRMLKRGVRYTPEIFALGSHFVRQLGPYRYSALHIRRNDFASQFGAAGARTPEQTRQRLRELLPDGEPLYIATDEADPEHLDPLREDRPVFTWRDLATAKDSGGNTKAVADALVGPVEQLICAAGRRFIGTRYSTFSMYIDRLRSFTAAPDPGVYCHSDEEHRDDSSDTGGSGRDWSTEYTDLWRKC